MIEGNTYYQCANEECKMVYSDFIDLNEPDDFRDTYYCPNCNSVDFVTFIPTQVKKTEITKEMVGE